MGKRSLALAWGSAALREAAATPPAGWNNINGLHDVSAMRARLGESRLSTQGQLMSFHHSGGVAAASPSAALPQASASERFPSPHVHSHNFRRSSLDVIMVSRLRLKATARRPPPPRHTAEPATIAAPCRRLQERALWCGFRFDHPHWRCACALCPSLPPLSQPRASSHRSR